MIIRWKHLRGTRAERKRQPGIEPTDGQTDETGLKGDVGMATTIPIHPHRVYSVSSVREIWHGVRLKIRPASVYTPCLTSKLDRPRKIRCFSLIKDHNPLWRKGTRFRDSFLLSSIIPFPLRLHLREFNGTRRLTGSLLSIAVNALRSAQLFTVVHPGERRA